MKRNSIPKTRRHIWIEDETWEKLGEHYGDSIGQSAAVNKILSAFLKTLETRAQQKGRSLPPENLETL